MPRLYAASSPRPSGASTSPAHHRPTASTRNSPGRHEEQHVEGALVEAEHLEGGARRPAVVPRARLAASLGRHDADVRAGRHQRHQGDRDQRPQQPDDRHRRDHAEPAPEREGEKRRRRRPRPRAPSTITPVPPIVTTTARVRATPPLVEEVALRPSRDPRGERGGLVTGLRPSSTSDGGPIGSGDALPDLVADLRRRPGRRGLAARRDLASRGLATGRPSSRTRSCRCCSSP